jgi:hypothetical protein
MGIVSGNSVAALLVSACCSAAPFDTGVGSATGLDGCAVATSTGRGSAGRRAVRLCRASCANEFRSSPRVLATA